MHVVVAVTPAHPTRGSLSKRRNQPATWFQLATVKSGSRLIRRCDVNDGFTSKWFFRQSARGSRRSSGGSDASTPNLVRLADYRRGRSVVRGQPPFVLSAQRRSDHITYFLPDVFVEMRLIDP